MDIAVIFVCIFSVTNQCCFSYIVVSNSDPFALSCANASH